MREDQTARRAGRFNDGYWLSVALHDHFGALPHSLQHGKHIAHSFSFSNVERVHGMRLSRQLELHAPLIIQPLRQRTVNQIRAQLVQRMFRIDVVQRAAFHPIP